ncbi:MAG TPA: hypothetical protein VLZ54_03045 [Arenibacter sp.]|nr:hypothetical protein [Arenibacter sp.]
MKYKFTLFFLLLTIGSLGFSQTRPEREHRIKKSQFPSIEVGLVPKEAKNLKYYQEVDTPKTTYILKFRLKKMKYHMDMDELGQIGQLGFEVKELDIPQETYTQISDFLEGNFQKIKIKRILQYYPGDSDNAVKNAFQNLILPSNTYELLFKGKRSNGNKEYTATFDAEGNILKLREALPANFDRVLY